MRHFNSTIQYKQGYCVDCPREAGQKNLIAGRCNYHYQLHIKLKSIEKREPKEKTNTLIVDDGLENWFLEKMKTSKRVCENCGANLSHYNDKDWRGSQHHIIDKSEVNGCPSVSAHPLNHGVLGKWCCHGQWHSSYEKAAQMPFFEIAVERFRKFEKDIATNERRKIPEVFIQELEPK